MLILFAKQTYLYSVDVHSQTTETQHEIDVWKRLDVIIMISSPGVSREISEIRLNSLFFLGIVPYDQDPDSDALCMDAGLGAYLL